MYSNIASCYHKDDELISNSDKKDGETTAGETRISTKGLMVEYSTEFIWEF